MAVGEVEPTEAKREVDEKEDEVELSEEKGQLRRWGLRAKDPLT